MKVFAEPGGGVFFHLGEAEVASDLDATIDCSSIFVEFTNIVANAIVSSKYLENRVLVGNGWVLHFSVIDVPCEELCVFILIVHSFDECMY